MRDFAILNTPDRTWQYGYTAPDGTGFTNYNSPEPSGINGLVGYRRNESDMGVTMNTTDRPLDYNICTTQQPDVLGLFPGNDGRKTVVRWKAPAAGTYRVAGRFQNIDHATADAAVAIDAGTVTASAAGFFGGFEAQGDHLAMTTEFQDANGAALGSFTIGDVSSSDRAQASTLLARDGKAPVPAGTRTLVVTLNAQRADGAYNDGYADNLILTLTTGGPAHVPFFKGESALGNGVYFLRFAGGNPFGYYSFLTDPHYVYHFDLGYEYVFEANDGKDGVFLFDFKSGGFFYTSPSFPFPYLYDFSLNTVLYYFPDPKNEGRYNTDGVRYFSNLSTGQIITK